jgi:hypothetical protein
MDPSHHSWLLGQSHPVIGLVLIAIGVEPEHRSVSRSLSGWGPKREPNALIAERARFVEAIEADLAIGPAHVNYRGRARV